MNRCTSEVLEDEDEIKVFETVLNTFEMSDLNLVEGDDEEGWFRQEDEGVGSRLK